MVSFFVLQLFHLREMIAEVDSILVPFEGRIRSLANFIIPCRVQEFIRGLISIDFTEGVEGGTLLLCRDSSQEDISSGSQNIV